MAEGFTIRVRGGGLVLREYQCPVHGVFEALVPRDADDVQPCPVEVSAELSFYIGPDRSERSTLTTQCCAPSDRAMSAPAVHTQFVVSASRGKDDAKPHHRSMDTRPLAEGMPLNEWKKERAKVWEAERHERVKKALE